MIPGRIFGHLREPPHTRREKHRRPAIDKSVSIFWSVVASEPTSATQFASPWWRYSRESGDTHGFPESCAGCPLSRMTGCHETNNPWVGSIETVVGRLRLMPCCRQRDFRPHSPACNCRQTKRRPCRQQTGFGRVQELPRAAHGTPPGQGSGLMFLLLHSSEVRPRLRKDASPSGTARLLPDSATISGQAQPLLKASALRPWVQQVSWLRVLPPPSSLPVFLPVPLS